MTSFVVKDGDKSKNSRPERLDGHFLVKPSNWGKELLLRTTILAANFDLGFPTTEPTQANSLVAYAMVTVAVTPIVEVMTNPKQCREQGADSVKTAATGFWPLKLSEEDRIKVTKEKQAKKSDTANNEENAAAYRMLPL